MLKLPKISLGPRYVPLVGLDITTSSIKLIELAKSGDGYRVEAYAAEPTPHNAINEKAIVDAAAVG
ncbi:MAG TPA: pilus assembly protein PilM, partial [Casimicrobiaceae bacterium]|nr:pilus assembly protein PilM [Casimicrobiaceae bacterium]